METSGTTQPVVLMVRFNIIFEPGMGNGTRMPWDFESRDTNSGLMSLIGYKSLGLSGLGQISLRRILFVPKSSHGTQTAELVGTETKIFGVVPGF